MKRIFLKDFDPFTVIASAALIGAMLSLVGWPLLVLVCLCFGFLALHYDEEMTEECWSGTPNYALALKLVLAFWLSFGTCVALGSGLFLGNFLLALKAGSFHLFYFAMTVIWGYVCFLLYQVTVRVREAYLSAGHDDADACKALFERFDIRSDRKRPVHHTYSIGDKIESISKYNPEPLLKGFGLKLLRFSLFRGLYLVLLVLREIFTNRIK